MTNTTKWFAGAIGVLAIGGGAFGIFGPKGKSKKDEVQYEFAQVARGDVRSFVTATGTIQPWKTIDIKSDVAGRITQLNVDLGSPVKQGQLIMKIDPTDTTAAAQEAKADLDAAEAKKKQAVVNADWQDQQAHARLAAADQSIASAQARLDQAKESMDVQPALTKLSIAQANAGKVSAEKSVAQAQQSKAQLEEQLATLEKVTIPLTVETVNSTAAQARANMQTAQRDLARQRELLAQGYVAKSDVEAAYSKYATLAANVRTADQRKTTLSRENQLAVNELKSRIAQSEASIDEAQARADQAQAELELAQKNAYQDKIRKSEYGAALAALKQARQDKNVALADLKQIKVKLGDVTSAEAQIVRSKASLKQATTNLNYTEIRAPRGGVVIVKNVEQGTVVPSSRGSIGSTNALLQIGDTSKLWVVCDVDETDIGQVSVGQKATVKVDAYPSLLVDGKVVRIDPQAKLDQNVTMIPVTVELDMPDPRFKPLMNATCEFITDEALNALNVPNEAVKEKGEGEYVVQVLNGRTVEEKPVDIGIAGQEVTQIRAGLKEGDQVITKVIEPEKAEQNNPFNPFNRFGGNRNNRGGAGGRGGGGGGGRGGGR